MQLRLNPEWRKIVKCAWSFRLMAVATILSAIEVLLPMFHDRLPFSPRTFSALFLLICICAMVARVVSQAAFAQPQVMDDADEDELDKPVFRRHSGSFRDDPRYQEKRGRRAQTGDHEGQREG